jgi:DNA repair exonuclease SbcCD ATPase subunit
MNKSFLPSNSLLTPFLSILALGFFLSTFFLWSKNSSLDKQNKNLLAESKKLTESLAKLEEENKGLVLKLEENQKSFEESIASLKEKSQALQTELEKIEQNLNVAKEEKTYLEDVLIRKTKEIEQIKNQNPAATLPPNQAELARKMKEKDDEIRRLNELSQTLSKRLDKLYKTTHDKISAINVAKLTLEETISEARDKIEQEWNTVDLGSIHTDEKAASKESKTDSHKNAKKEGKVLAVNEDHGFVVIDIGKADGIKNDTEFSVKKKDGELAATLSVLEIRDVMTACNVKELIQGKKIELNDLVLVSVLPKKT